MRKTGLLAELGEDRIYLSVSSGVNDFERRRPPDAEPAAPLPPEADR
jgi:hypothetical protein